MTLILKSNAVLSNNGISSLYKEYLQRVAADGGEIVNTGSVLSIFLLLSSLGISSNQVWSAVSPRWGIKKENGIVTKLYSLAGSEGDISLASGSFPMQDGGLYANSSNSNSMTSVSSSYRSNPSLITVFKPISTGNNVNYSLSEIFKTGASAYATGLILGNKYNIESGEIIFDAIGVYSSVRATVNLEKNKKQVVSSRLSDNNKKNEGFVSNQSIGTNTKLGDRISLVNASAIITYASRAGSQVGGVSGVYYENMVLNNITREQHIAVVNYLAR